MKIPAFEVCVVAALSLTSIASAQQRPPITGVSHICVYSSDLDKADVFYGHDLGGMKAADPENAAGVRYYFNPTQFVEVLPLPGDAVSISRLDHVAYKTANVEQMRRYLTAQGYAVPSKVEHGSDGSAWVEVSDPEGNHIQFVQAPAHPLSVPLNPLSHHMIHVGYMVHSEAAENAFYEKLLGFRPLWWGGGHDGSRDWISHQVPNGHDWVEYMVTHAPEKAGIPPSMTRAGLGSMNHFSLGVPNMEKAVDILYNGGRMDPKNSPKIGRDAKWQFNAFDPDQTRAELMEFQPMGTPCCSPFTAPNPTE